MLKAIALSIDVLVLVVVVAYFVTTGIGNVAFSVFLGLVGAASLAILVAAFRPGRRG